MGELENFSTGGWIVHSEYGVGQIKGIVDKDISGKSSRYVKIKASQSTFWLPVQVMDMPLIRPLSTPEELKEAIALLKQSPQEMSSNYKERHKKIQEARVSNSIMASALILRDLRAQNRNKGNLSISENRACRALKQQLVEEWAIVRSSSKEQVESELEGLLNATV